MPLLEGPLIRFRAATRLFSNSTRCKNKSRNIFPSNHEAPTRAVLVSTSNIIYDNLALEEWIYENQDFSQKEYLLLWKNRGTIVSGRHQNPWLEANVPLARNLGLDIARRSSGGGTVYHDEGNLNLSFLKSRESYNRRENLDLVVNAVTSEWDIDLTVNCRDDILLDKLYKVSGTAAKLGRTQSYHHFTLLHSVDQDLLQRCLQSPMQGASSKATKSFPSTVMNLSDQNSDIGFESLVDVISRCFLGEVGQEISGESFHLVDSLCEAEFPGVSDISARLRTWDWQFAKSPDFTIRRNFSGQTYKSVPYTLTIEAMIKKGCLVSLITVTDLPLLAEFSDLINKFSEEKTHFAVKQVNVDNFKEELSSRFSHYKPDDPEISAQVKWVVKCIDLCFNFL